MQKAVINPIKQEELVKFLDDKSRDVIRYFIKKSLFSQPEPRNQQNQLPIQIPKEHIEQWFTQALKVKPIGAGSYPVDIYNESENWGADIKMLNLKLTSAGNPADSDSGEASLGQKFTDTGLDLDKLFSDRKYEDIKDGWINLYKTKYKNFKKDYPSVKKIFYFFILRPGVQNDGADFYFTGAVLDLAKLNKVVVNIDRTTKTSVFLNNFIDKEYGNTKVYKSKKRLELRLRPKKWIDNGYALKISTDYNPSSANLRDEDTNGSFFKKAIEDISKVDITFEDQAS